MADCNPSSETGLRMAERGISSKSAYRFYSHYLNHRVSRSINLFRDTESVKSSPSSDILKPSCPGFSFAGRASIFRSIGPRKFRERLGFAVQPDHSRLSANGNTQIRESFAPQVVTFSVTIPITVQAVVEAHVTNF